MEAPPPVRGIDADTSMRLSAAKLWLVSSESPTTCGDLPYLASALYALIPVATERVEAMTVDEHWRLYVNPTWIAATDIEAIAARLSHLVWHLLADHSARARDLDVSHDTQTAWQKAADATIAELLQRARIRSGLIDPRGYGWPSGCSAEEYYARASGLPARVLQPQRGEETGPETPADSSCGSAWDGHARAYELPPLDDVGSVDQHDAEAIRRRVAIEWKAHHSRPGTIPGEWARWVEQILEPKVPWQQVLAAAVRRGLGWAHGHTDYTYTRISRRQSAARGVVLPALRRPVPEVAVVVDTSGSMDDGLLAQALAEIDGILASCGVNAGSVTVLAVDAAVHHVERVRQARDVKLGGGGGTDMGVGIEAALALRPRPQLIIVLTDGETPWPPAIPPVPVLAVLISHHAAVLVPTPAWVMQVVCS
jgi:predicted metal-dependent peptidase